MSSLRSRKLSCLPTEGFNDADHEEHLHRHEGVILNALDRACLDDDRKLHKTDRPLLGFVHWLLLALYFYAAYMLCFEADSRLPEPLTASQASSNKFSEGRAFDLLEKMADFGSKPSGSFAAEVLTKNFIVQEVQRIKFHSKSGVHNIDIDIQKPSDCYEFHFISGFVTCYKNITNVVVKMSPSGRTADHSVLVNCHFDSVVGSPGATDDLAACAVMLEFLFVLSQANESLQHSVIFLFNGAEENFLQGSHGFITKHHWRHTVRAFINMEGAGAGGREFLFQSGPANTWLLHAYLNNAKNPHGSILAQEIFESGIIISDTDFRVFRDYGRLSGLDLAFTRNSYLYHTEFDDARHIPPGSLQQLGTNILATLTSIANSSCLGAPCPQQEAKVVFFDLLGYFVVQYPQSHAIFINYVVCLVVLLKVYLQIHDTPINFSFLSQNCARNYAKSFEQLQQNRLELSYSLKDFLIHGGLMFISILVVCLTIVAMVCMVSSSHLLICWYSNWLLLLPLYILPPTCAGLFVHMWTSNLMPHAGEKRFFMEQLSYDVTLAILALVLFVVTYTGVQSTYFVLVHVLFPLLKDPCLMIIAIYRRKPKTANLIFLTQLLCMAPLVLIGSYAIVEVLHTFIPLMGRSGTATNPEFLIAAICLTISISFVLYTSNLVYISSKINFLIKWTVALNVVLLVIMCFPGTVEPFRFSDSAPRWRRLHSQHVRRRIPSSENEKAALREDSGLWLAPLDFRGTVDLPRELQAPSDGASAIDCATAVDSFCALPYYIPARKVVPPCNTVWLPAEAPLFGRPVRLDVVAKKRISTDRIVVNLTIDGADHISAFFTPLNSWFIDYFVIDSKLVDVRNNIDTHFIYLANVEIKEPWTISVALFTTLPSKETYKDPILYVGTASHEMHGEFSQSQALTKLSNLIAKRRVWSDTDYHWKWAMTMNSWTSDYIGRYVNYK